MLTDYEQDSPTVKNVKAFETFLNDNPTLYDAATVERTQTFQIDVNVLYNDKNIKGLWENFEDDLKNSPNHSISCIGLAIHQVCVESAHFSSREVCVCLYIIFYR